MKKRTFNRVKKRIELNDSNAFYELATWYYCGKNGLPQDIGKAFELWNRAAELGSVISHFYIALAYEDGEGVEQDEGKAGHHFMLATMGGSEFARHSLGMKEGELGNHCRAMKHYMIAARCGYDDSLEQVGEGYKLGFVTKEEYASTLRAHRASQDEMKSDQRDIAEELEQLDN